MFSSNTSGPGVAATDPQFNYVTMLLHGNGTNGAQNNTFLDSSTNNFTITRNGNTTQGTFSPYGSNWSNYFDGSGDNLTVANNAALYFGTGDFTIECWIYTSATVSFQTIASVYGAPTSNNGWYFSLNSAGTGLYLSVFNGSSSVVLDAGSGLNNGAWHHVAAVRTGTTLSTYIDGARVATTTNSFNITATSDLRISGYPATSRDWNGYISNFRIIKGSGPYNASSSTLTVPTAPLTAITNTSLLTCQSNRFIDNSTNAFTITRNGDVSVQRFSPFNPTAPYAASTDGGSGYFDASGDYLAIASGSTAVAIGTGDFTIECWYYPAAAVSSDVATLFSSTQSDSGSTIGLNLNVFDDRKVYIRGSFPTSNTVTVGAWNHIVASRVSGTTRIFINGVLGSSNSDSNNYVTNGCLIGARNIGSIYAVVNGYICDMKVTRGSGVTSVTVPTTPATNSGSPAVLCNFTNAGIIDNAEMNNLETVGNAQISTAQSKFGGASMAFDGTGDWIASPANPNVQFGTGDFTVEAWVYRNGSQAQFVGLVGLSGAASAGWFLSFGASNVLTFGTASGTVITSSSALTNTAWVHVAVSRSGTSLKMFFDGVQVASATDSTSFTDNAYGVRIGGSSGYSFNGYIDDLRITKGYARYTANFTPPSAPFPDN